MLRRSNIIQKRAPTARQTPDASPPPPTYKDKSEVNEPPCPPPQMYVSKVWESVWPEGAGSWGQDVTYLSQMEAFLQPMSSLRKGRAFCWVKGRGIGHFAHLWLHQAYQEYRGGPGILYSIGAKAVSEPTNRQIESVNQ
jgi:hypothetical protein